MFKQLITKREWLQLTVCFLIWRGGLFALSMVADYFLIYKPSFPYADTLLLTSNLPRWLFSWANFDGVHYLVIAEKGYIGTGLIQAFFPFLPYVLLHSIYQFFAGQINILLIGLGLTNAFAYALVFSWFGLVKKIWNRRTAWIATGVLFLFPTSFYFGALYTESIFLLAVIGAFLAVRYQKWYLVCLCTIIATASRVVGVFLIPALILDIWLQQHQGNLLDQKTFFQKVRYVSGSLTQFLSRNFWPITLVLVGFAGIGVYMVFLNGEFHDPFYFAHVQSSFATGREDRLILYPQVLWRATKILLTTRPFDWHYLIYIQEFVVGVGGLIGLLWSLKTVRWSYVLFALGAFLLPITTGTFSSLPRYILVCFPLFLLITNCIQRKQKTVLLWLGISTVLLIINTIMFIQGWWVA